MSDDLRPYDHPVTPIPWTIRAWRWIHPVRHGWLGALLSCVVAIAVGIDGAPWGSIVLVCAAILGVMSIISLVAGWRAPHVYYAYGVLGLTIELRRGAEAHYIDEGEVRTTLLALTQAWYDATTPQERRHETPNDMLFGTRIVIHPEPVRPPRVDRDVVAYALTRAKVIHIWGPWVHHPETLQYEAGHILCEAMGLRDDLEHPEREEAWLAWREERDLLRAEEP